MKDFLKSLLYMHIVEIENTAIALYNLKVLKHLETGPKSFFRSLNSRA